MTVEMRLPSRVRGCFRIRSASLARAVSVPMLGERFVKPQLRRKKPTQMCDLQAMVKSVLSVAGAKSQLSDQPRQIGMHVLDTRFEKGLFARLHDLRVDISLRFFYDLFDPGGMNSSILYQTFECDSGDLAPNRIETAQRHRLGRIVHDQVDARYRLERPDVSAFPAEDRKSNV